MLIWLFLIYSRTEKQKTPLLGAGFCNIGALISYGGYTPQFSPIQSFFVLLGKKIEKLPVALATNFS